MVKQIKLGSFDIDDSDRKRISEVLESGQFSPGVMCREFEKKFSAFVGRKYALFVNSGTDALRLALLAMKEKHAWEDGAKVVVPALTFPATLNADLEAGLTPYLVDVDPSYTLNISRLEHFLDTSALKVAAVIPVHLFGYLCDMDLLLKVQARHKFKILEDSCEAMGSGAGSYGEAAAFSTYQCHHIQTGVGGLAVTDDDTIHELMRSYANHGRDTAYLPGYRTPPLTPDLLEKRFRFERVGYSARATEFQAALGLGQLERFETNLSKRRLIANRLLDGLDHHAALRLPWDAFERRAMGQSTHSYMAFPIAAHSKKMKKALVWALEQAGVETRDLMPITNQRVFQPYLEKGHIGTYACADEINECGFYIPCHPQMTFDDVDYILGVFEKFFNLTKRSNRPTTWIHHV